MLVLKMEATPISCLFPARLRNHCGIKQTIVRDKSQEGPE